MVWLTVVFLALAVLCLIIRSIYQTKLIRDCGQQEKRLERLNQESAKWDELLSDYQCQYNHLEDSLHNISLNIDSKKLLLDSWTAAAEEARKACAAYESQRDTLARQIEENEASAREKVKKAEEETYQQVAKEFLDEFSKINSDLISQRDDLAKDVETQRKSFESALAVAKHNYQEQAQQLFYMLNLSDDDIKDIQELRQVRLKQPEVLGKAIWKIYYEKPYSDLVNRAIGANVKTGIYKITNIQNGMAYVGQSTNIAERWKQHIKRGIGAETPTQNKLYPVMYKIGPENFTFEVLEECAKTDLDVREDYWQDFYKVKEFGYSIK